MWEGHPDVAQVNNRMFGIPGGRDVGKEEETGKSNECGKPIFSQKAVDISTLVEYN